MVADASSSELQPLDCVQRPSLLLVRGKLGVSSKTDQTLRRGPGFESAGDDDLPHFADGLGPRNIVRTPPVGDHPPTCGCKRSTCEFLSRPGHLPSLHLSAFPRRSLSSVLLRSGRALDCAGESRKFFFTQEEQSHSHIPNQNTRATPKTGR